MKLWGKNIRSFRNSNEMVSDLVGTMVLLAISVVIFSSLYSMVLSYPFASDPATVTIIGTIDGSNIILEHRGGEALGLETTIPITIAGEKLLIDGRIPTVLDLLIDSNGDGLWNIGERLVYNFWFFLKSGSSVSMYKRSKRKSKKLHPTSDSYPFTYRQLGNMR